MRKPVILSLLALAWVGCRGDISREPPVHLNLNMDQQHYVQAQEASRFFADGRGMRPQVPGTVARGELRADTALHEGNFQGRFLTRLPVRLTRALLERGRDRYNIYCAPCHDMAGTGNGMVARRGVGKGMNPPTNFHTDVARAYPVGRIYYAMANGFGTMPSYRRQIPLGDRWAIVAYIRALQVAGGASYDMVPADVANKHGWKAPPPPPSAPAAPAQQQTTGQQAAPSEAKQQP